MDTAIGKGRRALVVFSVSVLGFLVQGLAPTGADASTRPRDHMLSLTNEDRASHDRAALGLDAKISRYAKRHSRDMAEVGYLYHSSSEQLSDALKRRDWSIGGENVGMGSSLDGVEEAFMDSKPHRKNILRSAFDHAAVGIVESDGTFWVTVIFYG